MKTDIWEYLSTQSKPILLYGMGNGASGIIAQLKTKNKEISGIFASEDFVRGQIFMGFPVMTYEKANEIFKNFIVLTAFGTQDDKVIENIKNIAKEQELYIPDVPVYGNTVFTRDFFADNIKNADFIRKHLTDERSKVVFENVINFKQTADFSLLRKTEDDEYDVYNELLKTKNYKNIFDLGAYTGDTVKKFVSLFPAYEKIVAVEPDIKNYNKLLQNTKSTKNIFAENAAISYLDGQMFFGNEGGRNQAVDKGTSTTKTITIDTLTSKYGPPDFIKFDIEGQELNGIIGGENTIKKYKPTLMVSAYHRSEDIFSLPIKILSLRNDYTLYIRHFPCIPCWDTYYFFI